MFCLRNTFKSKTKDAHFMKYLSDILKTIAKENTKLILAGNFNMNLLKFDQKKVSAKFSNCQMVHTTKISKCEKPSLIDIFFINFSDMHCTSGNIIEK